MSSSLPKMVFFVGLNAKWGQLRVATKKPKLVASKIVKEVQSSEMDYHTFRRVKKVFNLTININSWQGGRSIGPVKVSKFADLMIGAGLGNRLSPSSITAKTCYAVPDPLKAMLLDPRSRRKLLGF
jgi:hypothetical protein